MLAENAELTSRLIDVALTSSHNDVFDAAFGGEATLQAGTLAQLPLGHWSHEEVQRRHKEATEEVRSQPSHTCLVMGRGECCPRPFLGSFLGRTPSACGLLLGDLVMGATVVGGNPSFPFWEGLQEHAV